MIEEGAIIKHDIKKAPRTGDWRYMKPVVDETKCVGCGTCVSFCPEATITLTKRENLKSRKDLMQIDYEFCKGCGVCADVCPQKAIKMEKN